MTDRRILSSELEPFLIVKEPIWLEKFYIEKLDVTRREAIVYSPLGHCGSLLKFRNGCSIHLLRKVWGPPSEIETYKDEEVIIKIENCRLLDSWVPEPVTMGPDESIVLLFAKISGDIEILEGETC